MSTPRCLVLLALSLVVGCFNDPGGTPSNNDTNNNPSNSGMNNPPNNGTDNSTANNTTPNNGTPCEPSAEVCDGVDNDCDDEVDEDFATLGMDCSVGQGGCAATGQFVCNGAGDDVTCDAVASEPADELCGDEIDNDCDGELDEGFDDLGETCTVGEGECAVDGMIACAADMLTAACDAEPATAPEADEVTCDGLDNDCDGEVDEGCDDDLDGFCDDAFTTTADAACMPGDCNDESDVAYPGAPPACDDIDNDCNGQVDEIAEVPNSSWQFELDHALLRTDASSPVLAARSNDGFCIIAAGDDGVSAQRIRAFANVTDAIVEQSSSANGYFPSDLVSDGGECFAAYMLDDGDDQWDVQMHRFGYNTTARSKTVLSDLLFPLGDSWNVPIELVGSDVVFAYQPRMGNITYYDTLPKTFTSSSSLGGQHEAGITGYFAEFGKHPGTPELIWFSDFVDILAYSVNVGSDRVRLDGLAIDNGFTYGEMTVESVANVTFLAYNDDDAEAWGIREINGNSTYGRTGMTPTYGAVSSSQFYVNRELFAAAPGGLAAMIDPVADTLYVFDPAGASLDETAFTLYAGTNKGELLAARPAGSDILQLLWMTSIGDPTNAQMDATFEVADYTCY